MRFFTKGYQRSICFSGLCIYVLFIAGCGSSSDDPTEVVPVTPPTTQPGVQAGIYDSTVVEGADDLEFVISRLASASTETVSVEYTSADGTAVAGTDYSATNGVEQFAPGEVRKFVSVSVLNNPASSATTSKNMQLVLSNPQNAELNVNASRGTGTIIDSDAMSTDTAFNHNWGTEGVLPRLLNVQVVMNPMGRSCNIPIRMLV